MQRLLRKLVRVACGSVVELAYHKHTVHAFLQALLK
jgi:hypothetical protein